MVTVMDPVDLLCRKSAPHAPVAPGLGLPQGFQPMHPGGLPWMSQAAPAAGAAGQFPSTLTTSSPLPLPPGLEQQPRADASMRQPPACLAAAPVHVWALEAKIRAEQAQTKQQEWAEKLQLQYLRGQEVLKVLQEKKNEDMQPEETDTHGDKANTSGGAFDRFVSLMGLSNDSTCGSEHGASVDQTPQSKRSETWDQLTPPKQNSRTSVSSRKSGEKENKLSPEADTPQSKTRRGRRRGNLSFQ